MKYSIISINDRSKDNIKNNKHILKNFEFIENISYVDGKKINCLDILKNNGILLNWKPYDKRKSEILAGELGIWVSTINTWKYMIDNRIESLLVLEDDVILNNDFISRFNLCIKDLPKNFDFFSLYYFDEHFLLEKDTEIGSEYIHKSKNQPSAAQAILYSHSGAKKMLKVLKKIGIDYTCDCFIYKKAKENFLIGYSLKKENNFLLTHEDKNIISSIDPDNIRKI